MNPPVEAPASRQRRPATLKPSGAEHLEGAAELVPAPGDEVRDGRSPRLHEDRDVGRHAGRRLGRDRARHLDAPLADQLAGVLAGAGQPAAHQLCVEAQSPRRHAQSSPTPAGLGVQGPAQLLVGRLEDRGVLGDGTRGEVPDRPDHPVHGIHPGVRDVAGGTVLRPDLLVCLVVGAAPSWRRGYRSSEPVGGCTPTTSGAAPVSSRCAQPATAAARHQSATAPSPCTCSREPAISACQPPQRAPPPRRSTRGWASRGRAGPGAGRSAAPREGRRPAWPGR